MKNKKPKTNSFGECALCKLEKTRIKSHIIPDFVLNRLRNSHRQCFKLDGTTDRAELTHKDYWRHLLCEDCDRRIIGSREDLVAPVFDSWTGARDRRTGCETTLEHGRAKFDSIFYVILSLFWRCSVAGGHEYSNFKLPPDEEEALRQFLLDPIHHGNSWRLSPAFLDPWEAVEVVDLGDWAKGDTVFLAWLQVAGIAWFLHKEPILGLVEAEETWSGPFPTTHLFNLPGNRHAAQLAMKANQRKISSPAQ